MSPKWHLSHARGYIELGMLAEARAELEHLPASEREGTEFLSLLATIFQEEKNWSATQDLAERLVEREPENPAWWVMWAYATRRAINIVAADSILRQAEKLHPKNATIQFNLACYACQLGNLIAARSRLARAIALDEHFREAAETDPDLEPLKNLSSD